MNPRGDDDQIREVWEEFWDALDWIRLQMEKPWGSSFRVAFGKLLPLRERLALPGFARKTGFVGGDATLTRLGAVDWKSKEYRVAEGSKYLRGLEGVAGPGENLDIIAVMELLTFVVLASKQKGVWEDQMILYITDNSNVQRWLKSRRSTNKYVRTLLLLLQRLEAEHRFTVDGAFIRTCHNTLNHWLAREDWTRVMKEMQKQGWNSLELTEDWEGMLRRAVRPTLQLLGESGPSANLAVQLAAATQIPRSFERPKQIEPFRGTLYELRTTDPCLASFERAWALGGGDVSAPEAADYLAWVASQKTNNEDISWLLKETQRLTDHRALII